MPIYEYRCGQCGHEFETIQKVSEDPLKVCPACNESELVKKVSAAGFRLKGGGWYETDFKSGDKRNLSGSGDAKSGSDSGSGTDSGSGSSSGSDSGSPSSTSSPSSGDSSSKSSDAS